MLRAQNADTVTRRRRYRERVAQLTAQRSETMEPRSKPSREGSVAQGALALKYIIELSHRVGQVRLQHDPRTYSTMSLVLRVFWLPPVTSLFFTPGSRTGMLCWRKNGLGVQVVSPLEYPTRVEI